MSDDRRTTMFWLAVWMGTLVIGAIGVGSWHIDGRPVPYARFQVEQIEFDIAKPF